MSRQNTPDNHANQLNPNNDAYWQSRGSDERPDDWEEQINRDRAQQQADVQPQNASTSQ